MVVVEAELDRGLRSGRVLDDVGQGLLGDAVKSQGHVGPERPSRARDLDLDLPLAGQPGQLILKGRRVLAEGADRPLGLGEPFAHQAFGAIELVPDLGGRATAPPTRASRASSCRERADSVWASTSWSSRARWLRPAQQLGPGLLGLGPGLGHLHECGLGGALLGLAAAGTHGGSSQTGGQAAADRASCARRQGPR